MSLIYLDEHKKKPEERKIDRRCEICKKCEGRWYTFYYGKLLEHKSNTWRQGYYIHRHISTKYGDIQQGSGHFCNNCVFGFRMTLFVLTFLIAGVGALVLLWSQHLGGANGASQSENLIRLYGYIVLGISGAALVINFRTSQKTLGEVLGIVRNYFRLRKQGYNAFFTEDRYIRMRRFHI